MKKIHIILLVFLCAIANGQGTWTQKASLTALSGRFSPTGFSIGHYGFIGGGQTPSGATNDFWKWNQTTNTWSSIANYAGLGRYAMTSFTINGKGYTCLGWSGSANENDMWSYDTATNKWTQKASFPGTARYGAFAFVIGTRAYVGCGEPNGKPYFQDMWMYDAVADKWTAKANFPGGTRSGMTAFAFGKYGYAGCGGDGSADYNDMWQYDTATDSWTSAASLPVSTSQLGIPITFVLNGQAYVGTGERIYGGQQSRDFWSYDSATGSWSPVTTLTGVGRWGSIGFTVGNKGYVGMGWDSASDYLTDYWEYYPCSDTLFNSVSQIALEPNTIKIYPNPNNGIMHITYHGLPTTEMAEFRIIDMLGRVVEVYNIKEKNGDEMLIESNLNNGMYFYQFTNSDKVLATGKFIIQK